MNRKAAMTGGLRNLRLRNKATSETLLDGGDVVTVIGTGKQERRELILLAGTELFSRKGFAALTMDDIAREARVSKGGLYRHFQSKDELFSVIGIRLIEKLLAVLRAVIEKNAGHSGLATIRACIEDGFRLTDTDPAIVDFVIAITESESSGMVLSVECQQAIAVVAELLVELIERGREDGSIRTDVAIEHLALNLWGCACGAFKVFRNLEQFNKRVFAFDAAIPTGSTIAELIAASLHTQLAVRADREPPVSEAKLAEAR
jgi:AcrR family transcriptional regulator